ncbi:MAG: hypothetical protein K8T26_12100 [Lentisphaerae bacterium]|nr:hypothetical protein [Lentisphaerota bacterium]
MAGLALVVLCGCGKKQAPPAAGTELPTTVSAVPGPVEVAPADASRSPAGEGAIVPIAAVTEPVPVASQPVAVAKDAEPVPDEKAIVIPPESIPNTALTDEVLKTLTVEDIRARHDAAVALIASKTERLHELSAVASGPVVSTNRSPALERIEQARLRSDIRDGIRDRMILEQALQQRTGGAMDK